VNRIIPKCNEKFSLNLQYDYTITLAEYLVKYTQIIYPHVMMEQSIIDEIVTLRASHPDLIVIIYGPTATGKSGLSLRLADLFSKQNQGVEIISADSRQVYRSMDIGTDKISREDRQRVPHYAIDIIDPDDEYTAHQRQTDTRKWCTDILGRGDIPMIVGGTGLYIDTVYKNFSLPPDVKADRKRRTELDRLEAENP
jgi:tRNA A37 N6-isopentenylltransferase MiaA